jgi:prepilin-type processing-associated H-X9-DG protein
VSAARWKIFLDTLRCPTLGTSHLAADATSLEGVYGYHTDLGYGSSGGPVPAAHRWQDRMNRAKPMMACHDNENGAGNRLQTAGPSNRAKNHGWTGATSVNGLSPNHGRICNILFFDGHVAGRDVTRSDAWPWNDPLALSIYN